MWRNVIGYEGFYLVSDDGFVKSLPRWSDDRQRLYGGNILRQSVASHGYRTVKLCVKDKQQTFCVHTLVLVAFVGPRPDMNDCCHKDGNKLNNALWNLRWGTRSENNLDVGKRGQQKKGWKLTADDVLDMRASDKTHGELAKIYGVHERIVGGIRRRESWKHV